MGSHVTNTPDVITYFGVVSRDSVHIALIMAVSHDLEVKAADILSAYVMVPNGEFGGDAGKFAIIVRVLYSQRSVGALYGVHLAQYLSELGCK